MSRLCKPHWKELRESLIERGLGKWVSDSESELERKIYRSGPNTPEGFEPLMDAMKEIHYTAGFYNSIDIGEGCPLCKLEDIRKNCACTNCRSGEGPTWTEVFVEFELERARKLQLIPQPS